MYIRALGCSNGGMKEGLKILWPLRLCGFKSRFEYCLKLHKSMIYGAFCFPAFSKEELSFSIKLSHISYELCSSCKPRVKPENV